MLPDNLPDWLCYLETLHPKTIDLSLDRVCAVARSAGMLPFPFFTITVAGTNGKGTSCALLEAVFLAAGYRVGVYSSPHLLCYNERVRVKGEAVSDALLCEAFFEIEQVRAKEISLTYFEFGTLAALSIFKKTALDVVILEVGLGGRLDAVNIVDADVALINTIALDHMEYLGSDREAIGWEKSGIMRAGKPVVCGDFNRPNSVVQYAKKLGTLLYIYGNDFVYEKLQNGWQWRNSVMQLSDLPLPAIPLQNAAAVLQVLALLPAQFTISAAAIRAGLQRVKVAGRFQILSGEIPCILDVAHNPAAAILLAQQLQALPCSGRTLAVIGMLADKDQPGIIQPLKHLVAEWFAGSLKVARGSTADELAQALLAVGITAVNIYDTVQTAYEKALSAAQPGDRIIVFGSFYTVAQIMQLRL